MWSIVMLGFVLGFAVGERAKSPPEPTSFFERLVLETAKMLWALVKAYHLFALGLLLKMAAGAAFMSVILFTAADAGCEVCAMKQGVKP